MEARKLDTRTISPGMHACIQKNLAHTPRINRI
jgi:hypothetical protein